MVLPRKRVYVPFQRRALFQNVAVVEKKQAQYVIFPSTRFR